MHVRRIGILSALVLAASVTCVSAEVYTDGKLTVDWTEAGDGYRGTLTLNGNAFPAVAQAQGEDAVIGSFTAGGQQFPFSASLQGDTLTLTSGGKTYLLKNKAAAAPVNPLGGDGPVAENNAPSGQGGQPSPSTPTRPGGFNVVNQTDVGQAWSGTKANVTSVQSAINLTLADLAQYLDGRPAVGGAYEDQQTHKEGGAVFTAALKGQPVRGMISVKLSGQGSEVAVVFGRADARPDDWKKLTAAPPPAPAGGGGGANASGGPGASDVKLTTYEFPDGTGSIGVADGWKTQAQSGLDTIFIQGPADQHVVIGMSLTIFTPDSQMVQMMRQGEARARQMNLPLAPGPKMMIAPFSAPADALKALVPQLSEMYQQNGGPSIGLDAITSEQEIPARFPGGKAAVLEYDITRDDHGKILRMHNLSKMECSPGQGGMWSVYLIELGAPVNSFAQDKPTMQAIFNSMKENAEVCQRIMQQRQAAQQQQQNQQFQQGQDAIAAQRQRFETGQAAHRAQVAGYEQQNKAWAADQTVRARSNDNFIETIRGQRTIIDTQTGEKGSADLSNIDGVVNGLNEGNPGRFQQIPLRDENNPLPPGE